MERIEVLPRDADDTAVVDYRMTLLETRVTVLEQIVCRLLGQGPACEPMRLLAELTSADDSYVASTEVFRQLGHEIVTRMDAAAEAKRPF